MDQLLRSLLQDLARRCQNMKERVAALPSQPATADHVLRAFRTVERIRRAAVDYAENADLDSPRRMAIFLRRYKRLYEEATLIESYLLPFIERYNENDQTLTGICRLLARQINWPQELSALLVGSFSSEYYWTFAEFNVICASATETNSLLGLPDLCHEMGHILMLHHEPLLVGPFRQRLISYIKQLQSSAAMQQAAPQYTELYQQLMVSWADMWLQEFAADMIATYLVGPAYAWQHIRLCVGNQSQTYHPALGEGGGHPADEARLRGVITVLERIGADDAVAEVLDTWERYLDIASEPQPAEYDVCYPQELIDLLAESVVTGCRTLGLRSFRDCADAAEAEANEAHEANETPTTRSTAIQVLLNDAWLVFRMRPSEYGSWEAAQLRRVWEWLT